MFYIEMINENYSANALRLVNVPTTETQKSLEPILSKYGRVDSVEFVALQDSDSRYATVTYATKEEAEEAVIKLNETDFVGSPMTARWLTEAEKAEAAKKQGAGGNGGSKQPNGNASRHSPSSNVNSHQQKNSGRPVDFPLRILVHSEMVGAIIGRAGHKIREITQLTRARVDIHRKENMGMVEKAITIYGQPGNCTEACEQILKVMQDEARDTGKPDDFPLKILAHNNLVGRIIGKQGATIKRIMEDTDTKITVSSINEITAFNQERVITIRGDSVHNMTRAEAEISSKLRAAYEGDVMAPQMAMFPGHIHPAMMGLGYMAAASNFPQAMQRGTSATGVPHMGSGGGGAPAAAGGGNMAYFNNGNDNGGMSGAMAAMNINGGGHGGARGGRDWRGMMMAPQQEVCSIFIPSTAVGAVIGTKGTYIRQVIRLTGATIKINPNDEPNHNGSGDDATQQQPQQQCLLPPSNITFRRVTITGTSESQFKAQFCIFEKVQEDAYASGNAEVRWNLEVMVPSVHVGRIIGRQGANVRELQRKTGTMIKLPEEGVTKADETPVLIMGPIHSVMACQARLREMTRDAINNYNTPSMHYPQHQPVNGGGSAGEDAPPPPQVEAN